MVVLRLNITTTFLQKVMSLLGVVEVLLTWRRLGHQTARLGLHCIR